MKNKYILTTALILVLILLLSIYFVYPYESKRTELHFKNLNISQSDFSNIMNSVPVGQYRLCSMETGKCEVFKKVEIKNG